MQRAWNRHRGILGDVAGYEFFDHMADVGIHVEAESLEELFVSAARGLMAWIGPLPEGATHQDKVSVEAENQEELLVRWLQEVLCRFYLQHAFLAEVRDIQLDPGHLRFEAVLISRIWEEEMRNHYQEVKAVTYHRLKIERRGAKWLARIILDI